jgi:hypothetical protein
LVGLKRVSLEVRSGGDSTTRPKPASWLERTSRLFALDNKMLIVSNQYAIQVFKIKDRAIEIKQYSDEYGKEISMWIQPENLDSFCTKLFELIDADVVK